jgi:4-hydroxy-tetrahydrodipicolinate reductase
MKIALIGYGAMGQLVGKLAIEQGHEISLTLDVADADRRVEDLAKALRGCDAAIDFSIADTVPKNAEACALARVPLVVGTTGWLAQLPEVQRVVTDHNGALIYGANFSVGVQVFYRIAARAAELFRDLDSYDGFIEEAHHKRKRDAPSGTAIQLHKIVAEKLGHEVPVASTRAGYIPGTHLLGFDSAADQITLTHEPRSREGFAAGALVAARWIVGRKGVFEFSEVFDEIVSQNRLR